MKDLLIEILRPNQSWNYRWFRIKELIATPFVWLWWEHQEFGMPILIFCAFACLFAFDHDFIFKWVILTLSVIHLIGNGIAFVILQGKMDDISTEDL